MAIQRGAGGLILKPSNSGVVLDNQDKPAALLEPHLKIVINRTTQVLAMGFVSLLS
ncbi:hypothetical protein LXA47_02125 [Massilia sp. P8910]|uniref:hypothetical protein n=1 Tax=Massilia antarctica TaxID=2765360 RepID=UPI001E343371|nr:hypothetical protein [Massilia antarctica]MCE3602410.1 hypothetical protein [Massilia antarctica]